MSHLDEGTLHALLDGELELAEVREIQTHLGTCSACDSRLQDVKQFLAEADRLVGALEAPAGSSRARPEPAPLPSQPLTPREPPSWESAPELLLPDPPDTAGQRHWTRGVRWAAMILVVFGAGRLI
ncbi:MAG: zf-HC2 domain-containing protein, partial [Gemmatimonadales bacterium]|nr:zf-HC2 domain-containing protein [Gemmatimonadales bacterium]